MKLYDASGKIMDGAPPNVISSVYARSVYRQGKARVDVSGPAGAESVEVRHELVRAQVPHLVTLIVYTSKFQLVGDTREYFVYAPMDLQQSVKLAFGLWRRWEKPRRGVCTVDLREDYPKVDDAAVSEPIDDAFFDGSCFCRFFQHNVREIRAHAANLPRKIFEKIALRLDNRLG